MSTLPEVTDIQTFADSPGVQRTAVTTAALIAPVDDAAAVSAHVVNNAYARPAQVETDHGETLADEFRSAIRSGARRVFVASFETPDFTDQTVTDSDTQAIDEGDIPGTGPLYEVSSFEVDGSAIDNVLYTVEDPTTLTPEADEVYVNTITRKFKSGTTSSGAGAGITVDGKDIDTGSLFDQLLMRRFEVITVAGHRMTEQFAGLFDHVQTFAHDNFKTLCYTYNAGVDKADLTTLSTVVNEKCTVGFASPGDVGDANGGFAGMMSAFPIGGSMKEQLAPRGVSFTDTYTFADFGAHSSPAADTFHDQGIVAVYRDFGGTYRLSSDLSRENTGFYSRISRWRSEVFLRATLDDAVRAARRASPTAIPYTGAGLAGLEGAIRGALLELVEDEVLAEIDEVTLPTVGEVDASDREEGILPDVVISVRFATQIEFVRITVNLEL